MNRLTELLGTKYPLIQGGMIWCSGWELASAVSNAGGLGTIGSGSMYPDVLEEHVVKCKKATDKPFAVNLPLLYPQIDQHLETIVKHEVPVVITSAGSPKKYTAFFKSHGIKVLHVVSSSLFALKSQEAGVDAVIAEGFEAGGHNGREETTTMCLIPQVIKAVEIPVVAAGGIASGAAAFASIALGADGFQCGSVFIPTKESSAHIKFKEAIITAKEGNTKLTLHEIAPVRLLHNPFYEAVVKAYDDGASVEELKLLLGRGRAKKGMFEGDLNEGELEVGQVSAQLNAITTAKDVVDNMMKEYNALATSNFQRY
jgi:enoyl-[acyl-carrier protein] reductase II